MALHWQHPLVVILLPACTSSCVGQKEPSMPGRVTSSCLCREHNGCLHQGMPKFAIALICTASLCAPKPYFFRYTATARLPLDSEPPCSMMLRKSRAAYLFL